MKRNRIRLLAAMALLLAAAACVPKLREPDVHLTGVRIGGLGLQGGVLYVRLSVINPNRFGLLARGLTYDVDFSDPAAAGDGWVDFAEGTIEQELRVGARDSATVEIPVEFRYSGIGGAIRSVIETGTFNYRVRGQITVEEPLATEVPYRHRGTVSLAGSQ